MPTGCGYAWSAQIDAVLKAKADQYRVPWDFAFGTVAVESGFDPWACGDRVSGGEIITGADGHRGMVILDGRSPIGFYVAWECGRAPGQFGFSHGLLQLHTGGGQGGGMLWSQLVDPAQNLDRGLPPMSWAIDYCNDAALSFHDAVCCFARYSGHPGWVACNDYRVYAIETAVNCFARLYGSGDPLAFLRSLGCLTSAMALFLTLPFGILRTRGSGRRRGRPDPRAPGAAPPRKEGG